MNQLQSEFDPFDLDAPADWAERMKGKVDEFHIIIAALDMDRVETRLMEDHGAEHAATFPQAGHKIYRLDDGRFAVVCPPEMVRMPAIGCEVWNWLTEVAQPSFLQMRDSQLFDEQLRASRSPDLGNLRDFNPPFAR